jgi:hypothetical protein
MLGVVLAVLGAGALAQFRQSARSPEPRTSESPKPRMSGHRKQAAARPAAPDPPPASAWSSSPGDAEARDRYEVQARLAAPYWREAAGLVEDRELADACDALADALDGAPPLAAARAQLALANRLNDAFLDGGRRDARLERLIGFLSSTAASVIQAGDPATVPRPD